MRETTAKTLSVKRCGDGVAKLAFLDGVDDLS
jgi:hypothetical protein